MQVLKKSINFTDVRLEMKLSVKDEEAQQEARRSLVHKAHRMARS